MTRRSPLLAVALVALLAPVSPSSAAQGPQQVDLVITAGELHLGDGRTIPNAAVAIDDGRIVAAGPATVVTRAARASRHVAALLPGLLAPVIPESPAEAASSDPGRLAAASFDPILARGWTDRGVTAVIVTPGHDRLVSGRAGIVRLLPERPVASLERGAVCASLSESAQDPPLLFEPPLVTDADHPLPPARAQRPSTAMAAVGELRRLIAEDPAFADVREGRAPLRVHADREEDVRRALRLATGLGIDLILEGGAESWKLARELAAARVTVVLELLDPTRPALIGRGLDVAPDAAGQLAAAGVSVTLSSRTPSLQGDPLLLAAFGVRQGLSPAAAIAAVTGAAARAAGAASQQLIAPGAPADLAGFDVPPLALRARPSLVVLDGRVLPAPSALEAPLALKAGLVLTGQASITDGVVLIAEGRIVSVGTSPALPAGTRVRDFGRDAVLSPGFIDAFGFAGLEPGPPPGGHARLRALDAVEPRHPSLARALKSGVTTALVAPAARGLLLGSACAVSTRPLPGGRTDVVAGEAGFVLWLDEGPADSGARGPRLKAFKELIGKAKAHHDERSKKEKAGPDSKGSPGPAKSKRGGGKTRDEESDPALEALRALFDGRARAIVRSGRRDLMLEAVDALKAAGAEPVLAGAEEADLIAQELAARNVPVILSPRTTRRTEAGVVSIAAALRQAGVSVALGSFGHGGTDLLPLAACAAVRDGLSPEDALAALTLNAAGTLGLSDAGQLEPGARADVVAWSGDPMEPSSRVLAVVSGGRFADEPDATPESVADAARSAGRTP